MATVGGQAGNNNATKNKVWTDALMRELTGNQNAEKLKKLAVKLIEMAEEGDIKAIKEIGDRLEGKPAQSIDATIANPDGTNLEASTDIEIARKLAFVLDKALKDKESE